MEAKWVKLQDVKKGQVFIAFKKVREVYRLLGPFTEEVPRADLFSISERAAINPRHYSGYSREVGAHDLKGFISDLMKAGTDAYKGVEEDGSFRPITPEEEAEGIAFEWTVQFYHENRG